MQEHADRPDSVQTDEEVVRHDEEVVRHSDVSRWLAAASYLFFICLFVVYEVKVHRREEYVRFHARQGFALCFVEVILIILTFILGATLGTIPVLGAIIMIVYKLAAGLVAVGLSVWGFVEALGGEKWEMPVLGEYAKRVPLS